MEHNLAARIMDTKETRKLGIPIAVNDVALDTQPFSFEQNFPGPLFWLIKVSMSAAVMPVQPERTLDFA